MLKTVDPGTQGYTVRPDGTWVHSSRKRNMTQENLYAYTELTPTDGYPGFVSLNRQEDGSIALTVRSPGHGGHQIGTVILPYVALVGLAGALKHDAAGLPGAGG